MLNPFQEVGHDRLSKFEYFPGDPNATRASEEILIDAEAGFNDIHSGGFCGFKPSDYGNTVRVRTKAWRCFYQWGSS